VHEGGDGPGGDAVERLAARYRRWAAVTVRGRSPLYEDLANGVAADAGLLRLLVELPSIKRQPNLLLGAVRYLYGTPSHYEPFATLVRDHWDTVQEMILTHSTQTNEVARCATLLPLLAGLPQPLALLEVGASAGLCLLLDRYRYDFGGQAVGPGDSPVVLHCEARGPTPVPATVPEVVWRAGLDLNPLDVADPDATRWLEALVWPGEGDRLARLDAALAVARRHPPTVTRADMTEDLAAVARAAPPAATLVVFHSVALAYVKADRRKRFMDAVAGLEATWVANESLGVVPGVEGRLGPGEADRHEGDLVLTCDGAPVAWTDHHGAWVEWR
jgi:hypothetical protein